MNISLASPTRWIAKPTLISLRCFEVRTAVQKGQLMGQTNWTSLGAAGGTSDLSWISPQVVQNADGRLEVVLTGSHGNLWHIWQTTPGKAWSPWASLNKPPNAGMNSIPVVARNADGRIEVFTVGPDAAGSGDGQSGGVLWHIWQTTPGGSWGPWFSSGKPSTSVGVINSASLCVESNSDGRLEVFATGSDLALWHMSQLAPNGTWSSWASLAKPPTTNCTALSSITNADGRIEVFTIDEDSMGFGKNLWHIWQTAPGGSWSSWSSLGNPASGNPAFDLFVSAPIVSCNADGRLEVFLISENGALSHIWQLTPNGHWSPWTSLLPPPQNVDGNIDSDIPPNTSPFAIASVAQNKDGHLELIMVNAYDGAFWHIRQQTPGGSWGDWHSLGTPLGPNGFSSPSVIANADGRLEAFITTNDGALWHTWQVTPGGEWGS